MSVKKIILAILFASACIYSEGIDLADAEYCFDFRDKRQNLLFVGKNKGLEKIRNTEEVGCVHFYRTEYTEINFVDELGKNITYFSSTGLSGQYSDGGGLYVNKYIITPTMETLDFPQEIYRTRYEIRSEEDASKYISQFKDKIADGNMELYIECKPSIDTTYHFKFRAKITGKCTAEFLSDYDRSKRR